MKQSFFYKTFLTLLLSIGSIGAWAQSTSLTTDKTTYQAGETIYYELSTDGYNNPPDHQITFYDYQNAYTEYASGSSYSGSFQIGTNWPTGDYDISVMSSEPNDGMYSDILVTYHVESAVNPAVSMTVSSSPICPANGAIAAQVTTTDMGTSPMYIFYIDGNYQGGSSDNSILASQLSEGSHEIYVEVIADYDAPAPYYFLSSNMETVTISAVGPLPTLTLETPFICYGTPAKILFDYPVWQGGYPVWQRNGVDVYNYGNHDLIVNNVSLTQQEVISITINNMECNTTGQSSYTAYLPIQAVGTPNPVVTASGTKNLCEGQYVTLTNVPNVSSSHNFSWKDANDMVVSVDPSFVANQSGTYTMTVTDTATGCMRTSSPQVITVKPNPVVNASANGALDICPGTSVVISNSVSEPGVTYRWKRDGTTNVSTTSSYTAKTAGVYTLTATQSGCTTVSTYFPVSVKATPDVYVTVDGNTDFCGSGSATLSAFDIAGYTYQWYNGTNPIAGHINREYTATTPGSYKVAISNEGCTPKYSAATKITQTTLPTATITQTAATASAVTLRGNNGSVYGYQWYLDDIAIPGAYNQYYTATVNGSYTLQLVRNTCPVMSSPKIVSGITSTSKLAIAEEGAQAAISIYPNPSEGIFNIASEESVNVIVRDIQGRVIANINNAATVDLTAQPAGVYLMQIIDAKGNLLQSERLIKK